MGQAGGTRDRFVVLLVDDNDQDLALIKRGFADSDLEADLYTVGDGQQCMAFLRREGERAGAPAVDLVLLDLDMPVMDGFALLAEIHADDRLATLPLIVLSGSREAEDVQRCYSLGVNSFLRKPHEYADLVETIRGFGAYWMHVATLPTGKSGEGSIVS